MTGEMHRAGAAVVGRLTEIAAWEASLILSLRFWMEGPEGQAEVWNTFARGLGARDGRAELRGFETLLATLGSCARRPLVRHGLGCTCIGSDEAMVLTLVREAAQGDLAEAAMIASLLVPARHAEPVALMAAQVGQAMQRIAGHAPGPHHLPTDPENRTLH